MHRSEEAVSAGIFHPDSLSAATVVRYQDRWQGGSEERMGPMHGLCTCTEGGTWVESKRKASMIRPNLSDHPRSSHGVDRATDSGVFRM